jgi:hypothetical protein
VLVGFAILPASACWARFLALALLGIVVGTRLAWRAAPGRIRVVTVTAALAFRRSDRRADAAAPFERGFTRRFRSATLLSPG